jgi:putative alpha-1,2-mannosidase
MQSLTWVFICFFTWNAKVVSAANDSTPLTDLVVNLFIGTASGANRGSGGNGFPGAAVPHAMVKVSVLEDREIENS